MYNYFVSSMLVALFICGSFVAAVALSWAGMTLLFKLFPIDANRR